MDFWNVKAFVPWLDGKARNDTSQFGEDGLIEAAVARLGETNRWCFEVGAADGMLFSNTKRLRDAGWHAVLIEANPPDAEKCRQFANEKVQVVQEKIGPHSLDVLLSRCDSPIQPDFGVIDIDGQDYWAWEGLRLFRPRLILVEYMYVGDPAFIPPLNGDGQAGEESLVSLGKRKSYTLIAKTYCNLLFADSQCL